MTTSQPAPGGQTPVGQPDAFGPPPGVQPSAPKRSKFAWLKFALPIVIVVLVAGGYAVNYFTGTDGAKVGDCLAVTEFTSKADPKQADCGTAEANVKVAAKVGDNESCPEGPYDEYSQSGRISYKLCLMINAKQGECLANFGAGTAGYKKVPCSDPAKEVEFVKIVDGQADKAACEGTEATNAISYSTPPTTMCVIKGDK